MFRALGAMVLIKHTVDHYLTNNACHEKIQISLGIRVVTVHMMEATHKAHSEDLLDWADTQADLTHRSFDWFCHVNHNYSYFFKNILDAHWCFQRASTETN